MVICSQNSPLLRYIETADESTLCWLDHDINASWNIPHAPLRTCVWDSQIGARKVLAKRVATSAFKTWAFTISATEDCWLTAQSSTTGAGRSWEKVHYWSDYVVNCSSVGIVWKLWLTPHSVTNNWGKGGQDVQKSQLLLLILLASLWLWDLSLRCGKERQISTPRRGAPCLHR